jgi:uncharacterized membrane protein
MFLKQNIHFLCIRIWTQSLRLVRQVLYYFNRSSSSDSKYYWYFHLLIFHFLNNVLKTVSNFIVNRHTYIIVLGEFIYVDRKSCDLFKITKTKVRNEKIKVKRLLYEESDFYSCLHLKIMIILCGSISKKCFYFFVAIRFFKLKKSTVSVIAHPTMKVMHV